MPPTALHRNDSVFHLPVFVLPKSQDRATAHSLDAVQVRRFRYYPGKEVDQAFQPDKVQCQAEKPDLHAFLSCRDNKGGRMPLALAGHDAPRDG